MDSIGTGCGHPVAIREPGRIKGVRLFHLASILAFIERCEANALRQEQIGRYAKMFGERADVRQRQLPFSAQNHRA